MKYVFWGHIKDTAWCLEQQKKYLQEPNDKSILLIYATILSLLILIKVKTNDGTKTFIQYLFLTSVMEVVDINENY